MLPGIQVLFCGKKALMHLSRASRNMKAIASYLFKLKEIQPVVRDRGESKMQNVHPRTYVDLRGMCLLSALDHTYEYMQ